MYPLERFVLLTCQQEEAMIRPSRMEYCFLRYVPNVVTDGGVSIAAIFIDPADTERGICEIHFAADWQTKVCFVDPDADLEMLQALLTEIRDRFDSEGERSDMIRQIEDSFSNVIQISERQECPVAPSPEAVETLARKLLDNASKGSSALSPRQVKQHDDHRLRCAR
jgi:Protein of unknown function (DUF3037)